MRITSSHYINFESINSKSYIGTLVTTKDCEMSTGYRGRGCPIITEVVPAGTEAKFTLRSNGGNTESWLEVTVTRPEDKYDRVELHSNVTLKMPLEEAARKLHIDFVK